MSLRRSVALGDSATFRTARAVYRAVRRFHVPVPRPLGAVLLALFHAVRTTYYTLYRLFVCEPLFRAACRRYGRNVSTGVYVHFIQGAGDIVIGDDVTVDGKSSFAFGARFAERPTLAIGSRVYLGHACTFSVSSARMEIGNDVYVAGGCYFMDSPGHPLDPQRRLAKLPPDVEQVRPISIGDNVWIGTEAMILAGVTIGTGSVVAARAVVTKDVPPYTVVGGTPARVLRVLEPPSVAITSAS